VVAPFGTIPWSASFGAIRTVVHADAALDVSRHHKKYSYPALPKRCPSRRGFDRAITVVLRDIVSRMHAWGAV